MDLVMWRDLSRSALAFGLGTFIIISSSYSKDLNVRLDTANKTRTLNSKLTCLLTAFTLF